MDKQPIRINVAILGIGTVGGGTFDILSRERAMILRTQGLDIRVAKVLDRSKELIVKRGVPEECAVTSIDDVLSDKSISIVVETMGGVEPAKTFITRALESGRSVVTANKELIAKHGKELEPIAKKSGVGLYFEASCTGGIPIIRVLQQGMQANNLSAVMGIINGTTNYILTKMAENGLSYETALRDAQALGFAEFDPTADVEAFDAMYKLSILSTLAFHKHIPYAEIFREGITGVTAADIANAAKLGYVIKLLAIGKRTSAGAHCTMSDGERGQGAEDKIVGVAVPGDPHLIKSSGSGGSPGTATPTGNIPSLKRRLAPCGGEVADSESRTPNPESRIEARVHPCFVPLSHPLASVRNEFNAVFLKGDSVDDVMLYGRGAGSLPTASAIVSDIVTCAKAKSHTYTAFSASTAGGDSEELGVRSEERRMSAECATGSLGSKQDKKSAIPNSSLLTPHFKIASDFESAFYLALTAEDKAGVLAKIAELFAKYGISIAQMIQSEAAYGTASIIFLTHVTGEASMQAALSEMKRIKAVKSVDSVIRVL
ncbi:MAG: homoserine dehydrogenase [Firmicutes bacterium]|nr:homoserine dehydrogenase [Bacillota bacterium]